MKWISNLIFIFSIGCSVANVKKEEAQFVCQGHADCVMSCAYGAVNRLWYEQRGGGLKDCSDGCASDGFSSQCVHHLCEAFFEGKPDAACSHKNIHD